MLNIHMADKPTIVARAFELALSGSCREVTRIVDQLTREGYEAAHHHLGGSQIRKELRQTIRDTRA